MKIPMVDMDAHHAPIRDEILRAVEATLDSSRFILGPEVEKLERALGEYCGTTHALGVSSGTDALLLALMALGVGPGDEVVTTPYSFFATVGCIVRLGARPAFVDIEPDGFNIDVSLVEKTVGQNTKAIMPVHLYGQCADMTPLYAIAERHGVPLVEDTAQAIGSEYRPGQPAGSIGKIGCLSFFPSKNLGCIGDGGAMLTSDADLWERCRVLRGHGAKPKYYHELVGGNFRLDALQAAVLNVKLPYLDAWTEARRRAAARYDELFAESALVESRGVVLPKRVHREHGGERDHVFNQYVCRFPAGDRDRLAAHLGERGVATAIYYPVPLHLQECFRDLKHGEGDFPEAERAARETLAIPMSPVLSEEQQRYVVDSIVSFYG